MIDKDGSCYAGKLADARDATIERPRAVWFVVNRRRSEDATRSASAGQRSINIPVFDTIGSLNKIKKTRTGRHGRFSVSVFLIIVRTNEKSRIDAPLSFGAFVGSFHCPSLLVERPVFLCGFL